MHATKERSPILRSTPSHPMYENNEGLSPKKTAFIIVTVIGCVAILWPKVFYPIMLGGQPSDVHKISNIREQKGPGLGCCFNATPYFIGPQEYRKQLNLFSGDISLRQERFSHLHPDSVYQAMRERGRAISSTPTIPIVDRQTSANKPRFVEGRPGPLPGMRPPMGAGYGPQPQAKGNSMGFIMPLYTIGIVIFFGYTIMKLVFKKQGGNTTYPSSAKDPLFRKDVFGSENECHIDDLKDSKIVVTAIQGLIDAADEQLKKREPIATSEIKKNSNENSTSNIADISGDHKEKSGENNTGEKKFVNVERKQIYGSSRSVAILGMELKASCDGGKKCNDPPPTLVFPYHSGHYKQNYDEIHPKPRSIYLEGGLSHESKILVADSETKTENIYESESNSSSEEPAIVLSSKMTLSLINMDRNQMSKSKKQQDIDSPLGDDIEIISAYEQ